MDPKIELKTDGSKEAIELLIERGRRHLAEVKTIVFPDEEETVPVLVLPNGTGYNVVPLLPLLPVWAQPKPSRKVGTLIVHSMEAFCAYFNSHKEAGALIIVSVSETGAVFTGIMNGHNAEASHQDFRVVYVCSPSVEWNRWMKNNNKALSQTAFVEHLEDCEGLIEYPSSAELIKLLSSLTGRADANFRNAVNLFNGSTKLSFDEEITLRGEASATSQGEMEIPNKIEVKLPPFTNGPIWKGICRLRVRVANKALTLQYETIDTHLIIRDAVTDMIASVQVATEVTPLLGIAP